MGIVQEFKEFAVKGNAVDLAIGVVVGGAFGKIVTSLVSDIIMPPLGIITGGVDFKDKAVTLLEAVDPTKSVTLKYGAFLQTIFDFAIVAFALFLVVKALNTLKKKQVAPPPAPSGPTKDQELLMEIRDLLKKR